MKPEESGGANVWSRPPYTSVFVCRARRTPAKACRPCEEIGRRRASTALCDGPAPPRSRRKDCSAPVCDEHRERVGPNRDRCPGCARAAAAAGIATIVTEADGVVLDDRRLSLFDVAEGHPLIPNSDGFT